MQSKSKTELYQMLMDAVENKLDGTHITAAPKTFPVKKTMYYNVKNYLKGELEYEKLLYTDEKLEAILIELGVCRKVTRQTFFNIS